MGALVIVMVSPHLTDGCEVTDEAAAALVDGGWTAPAIPQRLAATKTIVKSRPMTRISDMTKEPENNEPNHKSDEEDLNDDDILMSSSGMTMGRFRQIQAAAENGEPLELSDEERTQYEETKIEVAELNARLRKVMSETLEPINQKFKNIISQSMPKMRIDSPEIAISPRQPQFEPTIPAVDTSWYDSIAKSSSQRADRENETATNIRELAAAAQDMLTVMNEQKDLLAAQGDDLGQQAKDEKRRHKQTMWVIGLTLGAAILIPFIILWLS